MYITSTFISKSRLIICAGLGLLLANCAQTTEKISSSMTPSVDPKYGVTASPRVVAEGKNVPKGGGKDHIGKSYKVAGKTYRPTDRQAGYSTSGLASWYGDAFHGRKTANGEIFDKRALSAAHPTMPLPSYVRVTNLTNNHSVVVRVNDRGPFHGNRILDVSQRAAEALNFKHLGTARVKIDYLGRASLAGSDDNKLIATLSTDGTPAQYDGVRGATTQVAENAPMPAVTARPLAAKPVQTATLRPELQRNVTPAANKIDSDDEDAQPLKSVKGVPAPPDRPFSFDGKGKQATVKASNSSKVSAVKASPKAGEKLAAKGITQQPQAVAPAVKRVSTLATSDATESTRVAQAKLAVEKNGIQ